MCLTCLLKIWISNAMLTYSNCAIVHCHRGLNPLNRQKNPVGGKRVWPAQSESRYNGAKTVRRHALTWCAKLVSFEQDTLSQRSYSVSSCSTVFELRNSLRLQTSAVKLTKFCISFPQWITLYPFRLVSAVDNNPSLVYESPDEVDLADPPLRVDLGFILNVLVSTSVPCWPHRADCCPLKWHGKRYGTAKRAFGAVSIKGTEPRRFPIHAFFRCVLNRSGPQPRFAFSPRRIPRSGKLYGTKPGWLSPPSQR